MPKPYNLKTLMAAPAPVAPSVAPGSSYEEVLNYARGLDPSIGQPVPAEAAAPGYQYAQPDPMAEAQHFAERQEAARKLSSPVTPALDTVSLPGEVWNAVLSLLGRGKK